MQINSYSFNNLQKNSQNFTSALVKSVVKNWLDNSSFFKYDLNWNDLMKILQSDFAGDVHVNVFDFGCLDGSDVYSLIMLLQKTPENFQTKFMPIKASDINKKAITKAQKGIISCSNNDIKKFERRGFNKNDFIKSGYIPYFRQDTEGYGTLEIYTNGKTKDVLRKNVEFDVKDIFDGAKEIPENEKSIVFARNVWVYLNSEKCAKLAKILGEKMKKGSLLIVGESETANKYRVGVPHKYIAEYLEKNNFKLHQINKNDRLPVIFVKTK